MWPVDINSRMLTCGTTLHRHRVLTCTAMRFSVIFTLATAAASVSAAPGTKLTPRTYKYVCCAYLDSPSDPIIQNLMDICDISAANDDILGFGCRKLMKGGTCSSSTKLGWCNLDSYFRPHIYTSCEIA